MRGKARREYAIRTGALEPQGSNLTGQVLRGVFLEIVKDLEPEVLKELAGEPLRLFRAAGWKTDDFSLSVIWHRLMSEKWLSDKESNLIALRRALWSWGEKWNLAVDWCLKPAFDKLADWAAHPKIKPGNSWPLSIHTAGYVVTSVFEGLGGFHFEHHGWNVVWGEDPKGYVEKVRRAFEAELKSYMGRSKEEAAAHGLVSTPDFLNRRNLHLPIEWFVRFRVSGWSIYRINKEYRNPESRTDKRAAIKSSIDEVAALLGLPAERNLMVNS